MNNNQMKFLVKSAICLSVASMAACGGGGDSAAPVVVNSAPVANAGATQSVAFGSTISFSGSGTDVNSDVLTFSWTLVSAPTGSKASLSAATSAKATLVSDIAGVYVASLVVNDGKISSPASQVTVTVGENPNASPSVLPLVGDYYVYSDIRTPTFPSGLKAIDKTYTNYYNIVNSDGSRTRSTSSSLSTALMYSAAYNSLGQLVTVSDSSRVCNYSPAYSSGAPRNSIVGDLFSGNTSQTCVPTTTGASTGWAISFTGKVDSAEAVTVAAGTFNAIKSTTTEVVTGTSYVDTIISSTWVDKVTGRIVKSTYTLNERLFGGTAIVYQEARETQLLAYSFNGQAPVGAAIKRFLISNLPQPSSLCELMTS